VSFVVYALAVSYHETDHYQELMPVSEMRRVISLNPRFVGAPKEEEVLVVIRAAARKKGKNKLSMRDVDREIRAHRIERSQLISRLRS